MTKTNTKDKDKDKDMGLCGGRRPSAVGSRLIDIYFYIFSSFSIVFLPACGQFLWRVECSGKQKKYYSEEENAPLELALLLTRVLQFPNARCTITLC